MKLGDNDSWDFGPPVMPFDTDPVSLPDMSTMPSMPSASASDSGPSWFGNVNWSGVLSSAINAWGTVEKSKTQMELAKLQAQNPYASLYNRYGTAYGGVTFPSSRYPYGYGANTYPAQQNNTLLWLLAGGALIAGAVILSR